jgi:hypothetical protein
MIEVKILSRRTAQRYKEGFQPGRKFWIGCEVGW